MSRSLADKGVSNGIYSRTLGTHGTSVPLRMGWGPLYPGDGVGNICSLEVVGRWLEGSTKNKVLGLGGQSFVLELLS